MRQRENFIFNISDSDDDDGDNNNDDDNESWHTTFKIPDSSRSANLFY